MSIGTIMAYALRAYDGRARWRPRYESTGTVSHREVLPSDHRILDDWVGRSVADVHGAERQLHPLVQELQDLIEGDAHLYMRPTRLFTQIPKRAPFDKSPTGEPRCAITG